MKTAIMFLAMANLCGLLLMGCGGKTDQPQAPAPPAETSTAASPVSGAAKAKFAWDAPEGWTTNAPTDLRQANLSVGEAECYLTVLPGSGGGSLANVNRWRAQFSLDDLDEAAFAALPKISLLGKDAIFVELDGAYSGMGDQEPKENYKLLGAILEQDGQTIFVKMTGPAETVATQTEAFKAFCASIRPADPHVGMSMPADPHAGLNLQGVPGDPHAGLNVRGTPGDPHAGIDPNALPPGFPGADSAGAPKLAWRAPGGWVQGADRPMRDVTFTMGDDGTELYVSTLLGAGGGALQNANRWRAQLGQDVLDEAALAAAPKIRALGAERPLIEAEGTYTGMGGMKHEGWALLGTICELPTHTVFVKMVGPKAAIEAQREKFIAFCESLEAK